MTFRKPNDECMHKNAKQKIEDRKIKIELVSQKYYTNQNQMPTYHLK